ncbi:MAG: hypothetical protein AABZ10_08205, partial [Nitrospirota bacterium]
MKSTLWRSLFFAALWLVFSGQTFAAEAVFPISGLPPLPFPSPARDILFAANEGPAMPARRSADEGIFKRRPHLAWPVYYHNWYRSAHERYYFGPLWMYEKKDGAVHHYPVTLSPYWRVLGYTTRGGSVEEIGVLSPFIRYRRGRDTASLDLLWPFVGYRSAPGRTEIDLLWPFTGYTSTAAKTEVNLLWPFTVFSNETRPDFSRQSYFLLRPLLGYYREVSPGSDSLGLLPFYYRARSFGEDFRYVFPTFLKSEKPSAGASWQTFFPFYYSSRDNYSSTLFIAPSFYRRTDRISGVNTLLPFYYYHRQPHRTTLYVFPTFFDAAGTEPAGASWRVRTFFPLFYFSDEAGRESRYIFPNVLWGTKQGVP